MNTELEEMREQLDLLKKKLEKQEIISERLISKTKESLEKDMATVRRQYRIGRISNFFAVPLIYYIVVYQLGLSVPFGIATAIWAFVTFVIFFLRKGHLYNLQVRQSAGGSVEGDYPQAASPQMAQVRLSFPGILVGLVWVGNLSEEYDGECRRCARPFIFRIRHRWSDWDSH